MSETVEGRVCQWAEYPAEPPNEMCERPATREAGYSTQEGGSVELWLCEEHFNAIHGRSGARAGSASA